MYWQRGEKMADFKQSLQAAQRWLHRAEDEWEQEHGIRAKLHLMLAEAELKRASGRTKKNSILIRGTAFLLTALIIIAYGYWSFANVRQSGEKPLPVVLNGQEIKSTSPEAERKYELPHEIDAVPQNVIRQVEINRSQAVTETAKKEVPDMTVKASTGEKVVSEDELQGLVRTAGKALRNQPKMLKE